jgi:MFS transporter, ACS family, glucarate transporter
MSQRPQFPMRYIMVLATFLLAMLVLVDRACISVVKDAMSSSLGLTDKEFGWVLSVFALGYALFQAPAGYLADRYGARAVLTGVVLLWSMFTVFTGLASGFISLILIRFLFGMGEAGAFPGIAKMISRWIPVKERGTVNGINFSGGRVGTALALPFIGLMEKELGWQNVFFVLGGIGIFWAAVWYFIFRDDPSKHSLLTVSEKLLLSESVSLKNEIKTNRLSFGQMLKHKNVVLLMAQYFSSNFTFFFCLSWLVPHMKQQFDLSSSEAGFYSSIPIICGAIGNVFSGIIVDFIYRKGNLRWSRNTAAMFGFSLAASGLLLSQTTDVLWLHVLFLSMAVLGADMTLSPSWTLCADISKHHTAFLSGTMNMAGNLGSFMTALAFPYLKDWTGSVLPFFYLAAFFNVLALLAWFKINPLRVIDK